MLPPFARGFKIASMKDKLLLETIGVCDSASMSEDGVSESEVDSEEDDSNCNEENVGEDGVLPGIFEIDVDSKEDERDLGIMKVGEDKLPHRFELSNFVNDGESYKHVN